MYFDLARVQAIRRLRLSTAALRRQQQPSYLRRSFKSLIHHCGIAEDEEAALAEVVRLRVPLLKSGSL